ncbi:hypothetical protein GZ77_25105 [Endozoicomonas montiporae]|uniref:Uncharacterized protein n=2 Tax=Endozoicomonas montiporae TaxID=1027273 RepID=A0A081MYW9_9GAMM|nr:hypothetical protein [Endozoicomonas montiporae]AMO54858.1 hypothetical protein EZMO1_0618 [Endozoicomonas montiporae CL-33]KEQ11392.1 hypothetical protein GZ77_25105 [Endozoicomonas montiporae]
MKSFFSRALLLTLLSIAALPSIARESAPKNCWFDTTKDTAVEYGTGSDLDKYVGNVCFFQNGADYYIGKVINTRGIECYYTTPGRGDGYIDSVRWLVTDYSNLKKLIDSYSKSGRLSMNINKFQSLFPDCTTSTEGHTPVINHNDLDQSIQLTTYSLREICLSDEERNGEHRIRIGYSQPGQCHMNDDSPYYLETPKDQPKGSDGCPIYNPDTEFTCEGYEFYRRGWAEECLSAFGAKTCYESTTCKKKRSKEECCKFAHNENCETVSMDTSGKCCCGVKLNKDNDRCKNVGLRKK